MTTSLVTGGLGLIGHHLVRELIRRGDKVVIVDNLSNNSNNNKIFFDKLQKKNQFKKSVILRKLVSISDPKSESSSSESEEYPNTLASLMPSLLQLGFAITFIALFNALTNVYVRIEIFFLV